MTDYLRPMQEAVDKSTLTLNFFASLSEEENLDILISFGEYNRKEVSALFTSELYRYHLYLLHTSNQWSVDKLKELGSVFKLQRLKVYEEKCWLIHEPSLKIDYAKLQDVVFEWLKVKHGDKMSDLVFKLKNKVIVVKVPTLKVIQLQFTIHAIFQKALYTVSNEFPKYHNEMRRLIEDSFNITPDLNNFVKWVLEEMSYIPIVNYKLDEKNQYANFDFDFEPLMRLTGENLRNEIINYCRHVNQKFKKEGREEMPKTSYTRGEYNNEAKVNATIKFARLVRDEIEAVFRRAKTPNQKEIIKKSFAELEKTSQVKKKTLYSYLNGSVKEQIYKKEYSEIKNLLKKA